MNKYSFRDLLEKETYDLLYQIADERMYNCKHKNKNNIPCFEK